VRTQLPPTGEVGALATGVNDMAEALQAHRGELEKRIREATADLAAKKDMAERANQAKSRFFAAASHDLRQPLHALSLFVAALKARNQQPETQTLIDNIEASTAAMELLFNALLDISRLDAGAIEAHPVHFPLHKLLLDLEQQFGALAADKQLRLRFRPCDVTLYSDPLLIERILVNLIANAIRYTDDGGVLVACRRRGRMVRISVIDTGRGIPPDQQESVFQEFVQLHNPARDRSKGLGLGLAIVSRLGRLLGHRVDLRSRPGHGSMFSIDVPLRRRQADPAGRAGQRARTGSGRRAGAAGRRRKRDPARHGRTVRQLEHRSGHRAQRRRSRTVARQHRPRARRHRLRLPPARRHRRHRSHHPPAPEVRGDIPAILVTGDTAPDTILRISRAGFPAAAQAAAPGQTARPADPPDPAGARRRRGIIRVRREG
jgi:two-component system, sensor histidine kinase